MKVNAGRCCKLALASLRHWVRKIPTCMREDGAGVVPSGVTRVPSAENSAPLGPVPEAFPTSRVHSKLAVVARATRLTLRWVSAPTSAPTQARRCANMSRRTAEIPTTLFLRESRFGPPPTTPSVASAGGTQRHWDEMPTSHRRPKSKRLAFGGKLRELDGAKGAV
jgi:hypothetical protein